MAWMQCRSCSAKFAVGLLRCPQCQELSELFAAPEEVIEAEQEANMPKISVEGGPSNALGQPVETEAPVTEAAEPAVESEAAAHIESETSDATSDATDEVPEPTKDAADTLEDEPTAEAASAPKPARKTAAKKAAAKQEPAPKG